MLRFSEHIAWCTKPVQLDYIVGILWAGLVRAAGLIGNVGLAQVVTIAAVEQAQVLWLAVNTLKHALGGSNELIGGPWIDECCRQPNLIDFICNSDVTADAYHNRNYRRRGTRRGDKRQAHPPERSGLVSFNFHTMPTLPAKNSRLSNIACFRYKIA